MGAKISFVFAAENADLELLRRAIEGLAPGVRNALGSLKVVAFHNTATGVLWESVLSSSPSENIQELSANDIVTFYPEDSQDGCVMVALEGRFAVINIALRRVMNPLGFLREGWRRVGGEFSAALMGEELEVGELELDALVRNGRIPKEADLCEAAIVKGRGAMGSIEGRNVEHGAVMLFR